MPRGAPGLAALTDDPSPELLRDLLHEVIDPELGSTSSSSACSAE